MWRDGGTALAGVGVAVEMAEKARPKRGEAQLTKGCLIVVCNTKRQQICREFIGQVRAALMKVLARLSGAKRVRWAQRPASGRRSSGYRLAQISSSLPEGDAWRTGQLSLARGRKDDRKARGHRRTSLHLH